AMPYENLDHPGASGGSSNTGEPSMKMFTIWVLIAQAVGLLAVILTAVWMSVYHGGFSWVPERVFNFHPLFMVIGLVFLYADGILVYRVFRSVKKFRVKVIHASLHILALIFAIVGLKAVFDSHNLSKPPKPNMWSLHSWLGLTCVLLFCLQWVGGLIHFLLPQTPQSYRKMYLPIHQHWGVILFCMTTVTAITGITEKNAFHDDASKLPAWEKLSNTLGFVLGIFCILVVYIVRRAEYQRVEPPAEPDEEMNLQQPTDEEKTG
ncbi:hypothetical protein BOX15_Mlig012455g3, partial [Macrostomum lignano]